MNFVFIGNGIISLMTAWQLKKSVPSINIKIIGPAKRDYSASVAAVAMLNSFAELGKGSLDHEIDKRKFQISRLAGLKWENLFSKEECSIGRGTFLLNNASSDHFDDENFNAIHQYLQDYNEPFEWINPSDIPNYKPVAEGRAIRAIYIQREGFVNSEELLNFLNVSLLKMGCHFEDSEVSWIQKGDKNNVESITLLNGKVVYGDKFLLAPGANFSKIIEQSNLDLSVQEVLYGSGLALGLKATRNLNHCIRTPNRGLACGVYAAPRTKETFFVGASNYIANYGLKFGRVTSAYSLLKASMEQINQEFFKAELVRAVVGWRPTTEDTYPLIGQSSISNLIIATDTKRDGFHCSPVISEHLKNILLEEQLIYQNEFEFFAPERKIHRILGRQEAINKIVEHQISAMFQHDFVPPKSSMLEDYRSILEKEANDLHDLLQAHDWGINPELYGIYKAGILTSKN